MKKHDAPKGIQRRLPTPELTEETLKRFWSKVDKKSDSECWEWNAALRSGYGCLSISTCEDGARKRKVYSAHRLSFIIAHGEPDNGLIVGHKCDNRKCCNPHHLEAITPQKNVRDAVDRSNRNQPRGEQIHTAVLTESDVHRICKARLETKVGAVKIARMLDLPYRTVKGVLERHAWTWITAEYGV
jgi:hypothetical protein